MRLVGFTVVGAAVVAAGLATPAAGDDTAAGDGMSISPADAHPGDRIRLHAPGCTGRAESSAFAEPARLTGRPVRARVKRGIGTGTYTVTADCGTRQVTGRIVVSTSPSWPSLLPGALNPQMARVTQ